MSTSNRSARAPVLLLALTACATTHVELRPRERAQAESPEGYVAALYVLDGDERPAGEVRVWSEGVDRTDDDEPRTLVHVGFEIENQSDDVLALDLASLRISQIRVDDTSLPPVTHAEFVGHPAAPARAVTRVDVRFRLPDDLALTDLRSLSAEWAIRAADSEVYRQVTPFRRYERERYWSPHYHLWFGWGPYYCW